MTPGIDGAAVERVTITESKRGSRLKLRVRPGARVSEIAGEHGGALKVSVTAPPEKGKANQEVEKLLADTLQVPRSSVRIVAGHAARDKIAEVASLPPETVRKRLRSLRSGP